MKRVTRKNRRQKGGQTLKRTLHTFKSLARRASAIKPQKIDLYKTPSRFITTFNMEKTKRRVTLKNLAEKYKQEKIVEVKELCETEDRTKARAAANEAKDIARIIEAINKKDELGLKLIKEFKDKFDLEIVSAKERRGSRRTHYDFDILVNINGKEVWKHVEHKGSKNYKETKSTDTPWSGGVQFYNGSAKKFSFGKKFARLWYDKFIGSGEIKKKFDIKADIPSFETWYNNDCMNQSKAQTEFGKELYEKQKNSKNDGLAKNERKNIIETIEITEEDLKELAKEVLPIVTQVLNDKDYWLSIKGTLSDKNEIKWYPKLSVTKIDKVDPMKCKDLWFEFHCDNDFTFKGHLRWGYGQGVANLRFDLK